LSILTTAAGTEIGSPERPAALSGIGFDYMTNAGGRLAGTVLSGCASLPVSSAPPPSLLLPTKTRPGDELALAS
jgi:hypothetical protein